MNKLKYSLIFCAHTLVMIYAIYELLMTTELISKFYYGFIFCCSIALAFAYGRKIFKQSNTV
jgi:hypothetical protein